MQVVHFHERNSGGVVYATHDGDAITRWQVCDDRRFPRVRRGIAAVLNLLLLCRRVSTRMLPTPQRQQSKKGPQSSHQFLRELSLKGNALTFIHHHFGRRLIHFEVGVRFLDLRSVVL